MLWQPSLPDKYTQMTDEQLVAAITARRAQLGGDLVILGHHYQQDEVIRFADFAGDSFLLSQLAARQVQRVGAKYVIFCGVHFMAESADVLTPDDVAVILPDLSAGCSMADMADYDQTVDAWEQIEPLIDGGRIIPVCYMNSSAAIKAFCGEHGGAVCTSSNCQRVFQWALAGGTQPKRDGESIRILFLPDEHLGRNTAYAMDVPLDRMPLYDPFEIDGAITPEQFADARVILWKGFCSVHGEFNVDQIEKIRSEDPAVNVIVHPECTFDVVQAADDSGSTSKIVKVIEAAEPGSSWAVGTEINLIKRLAEQVKDKNINVRSLSGKACPCSTMYRIDLPHLTWIMQKVTQHSQDPSTTLPNQIKVDPETRKWAKLALDRMMDISAQAAL